MSIETSKHVNDSIADWVVRLGGPDARRWLFRVTMVGMHPEFRVAVSNELKTADAPNLYWLNISDHVRS